jgi:hypothetical protein
MNNTEQHRIYAWLGYWRDKMPPEAVEALQDILGPLQGATPASSGDATKAWLTVSATVAYPHECICPKCGIRHGGGPNDGSF